jgi:hypothetical protein
MPRDQSAYLQRTRYGSHDAAEFTTKFTVFFLPTIWDGRRIYAANEDHETERAVPTMSLKSWQDRV